MHISIRSLFVLTIILGATLLGSTASAATLYYQNSFEENTAGWTATGGSSVIRTESGTDGVGSLDGDYHAIAIRDGAQGPYTNFGGYTNTWPGEWDARIAVYLNPAWQEGSGFIYSVATNNSAGAHLREYALHAGVVKDETTGGIPQLIVIADTSSVAAGESVLKHINAMSTDRRVAISEAGWYIIEQQFRSVNGKLVGTVRLLDAEGEEVFSYTKPEVTFIGGYDPISNVGGNRYGWFTHITIPGGLAIDAAELLVSPVLHTVSSDASEPVTIALAEDQHVLLPDAAAGVVSTPTEVTITNETSGAAIIFPEGTTITVDDPAWDGTFPAPKAIDASISITNHTTTVAAAVSFGPGVPVSFSVPVRIVLSGQAGKKAGYIDYTDTFHPIQTECGNDPYDTIAGGATECYASEGSDLAIYTTHLTTMVAYTSTPVPNNSGGGGSSSKSTAFRKPATETPTTETVAADVQSIILGNRALFTKAHEMGIALPAYVLQLLKLPTSESNQCPVVYSFTRNLRGGSEGEDVRALQSFLNCAGFTVAITGDGAPGQETTYFGTKTEHALIRFQEHYAADILAPVGETKGTGVFSTNTREKMRALMKN